MRTILERVREPDVIFDPPPVGTVLYMPGLPGGGDILLDRSIYRNNGTITEALWTRLPSGLWGLRTDGSNDFIAVTQNASFNFGVASTSRTIKFWTKCLDTTTNDNHRLFAQAGTGAYGALIVRYNPSTNAFACVVGQDGADGNPNWQVAKTINLEDKYHHIVFSYTFPAIGANTNTVTHALIIDGVDQAGTVSTAGIVDTSQAGVGNLFIGKDYSGSSLYNGEVYLPLDINTAWTLADAVASFNQERHRFGV